VTAILDAAIDELAPIVGRKRACEALGRSRASHYRQRQGPGHGPPAPRRSPRALSAVEAETVIETLNEERFCDKAPAQVWATLLDEGTYLASVSTMYRLLRERHQVRERRAQARRPALIKPELVAVGPNQVWSWDITKLAGPYKWTWFQLYTILDIYSRYVVGWLVAPRESAKLAEQLIAEAIYANGIDVDQLTLHADRGSSMRLGRSVSSSPTSACSKATPGRTSPTTTPTPSRSSRRSNTRPPSQNGSPTSLRLERSAKGSSSTTTMNTATRVSASTPQPTSTSASPTTCARNAKECSTLPTPTDRIASENHPRRPQFPTPPGSTHQRRNPSPSEQPVSHSC
jgi:transposase InsO family protein